MASPSQLSSHILPTAATMVGVGVTVISLIKILGGKIDASPLDEIVAVTSVGFLVSTLASYVAIRRDADECRFHAVANWSFVLSMIVLTGSTAAFAFEMF